MVLKTVSLRGRSPNRALFFLHSRKKRLKGAAMTLEERVLHLEKTVEKQWEAIELLVKIVDTDNTRINNLNEGFKKQLEYNDILYSIIKKK